jgi:hypothetical protein
VELQGRVNALTQQGLGVVAISYDSPTTLKNFATTRGITFPLISDEGSAIIKRYGLLNTTMPPDSRFFGVPYPGTFVVDRHGTVRARYFEEAYQERSTAASILVRQGASPSGPTVTLETTHLVARAAASDHAIAPGSRISLAFDITPRRGMHVYAPGKHTYQVVRVVVDQQPWLRALPPMYPPSQIYDFKPLNESVEVYSRTFRLVQDVTILATPDAQKLLAGQTSVTITARLEYQACDDSLCYSPQRLPVSWTFAVRRLEGK